ncbi:hypothetical protein JKY72_04850 [Candidatus Gracilibacteria bacterium]|nr:hypothetical protein [Candidatus Gracilibacteria bacterium]
MSNTKGCPQCSEKINESAKKCKHCHADLRNWFVKHKILTTLLALFLIGAISSAVDDGSTAAPSRQRNAVERPSTVEVGSVTAKQLADEYIKNEIAADEKYLDQIFEVSGVVDTIGKDILDDMYVTLKTNHFITSIQCMLENSELEKAANLNKGDVIKVQGKVGGKLMNVFLRDCFILGFFGHIIFLENEGKPHVDW